MPAEPLSESLLEIEVEPEEAILFALRNYRPLFAHGPFHAHDLRVGVGNIGDIGEGDVGADLLFDGQACLRVILNAVGQRGVERWVNAELADSEEALQASRYRVGDHLPKQRGSGRLLNGLCGRGLLAEA